MEYQSNKLHTVDYSEKRTKAESLLDMMGVTKENKEYVLSFDGEAILDDIIRNPKMYDNNGIRSMRIYMETA